VKLCLGTVQFGLAYGVTGSGEPVSSSEVTSILAVAREHDITYLDTASVYGNSEDVIGKNPISQSFDIASKCPPGISPDLINNSINNSLDKLGRDTLPLYYLHHASDFLDSMGPARVNALSKAKDLGLISGIGASVYSPDEALSIMDRYSIQGLQIPLNVFDQRFLDRIIPECRERGIHIFARSLFLQGSLLSDATPSTLSKYSAEFNAWREFCSARNVSLLEGCLHFARQLQNVDYWVIGVHRASHLVDIFHAISLVKAGDSTYDFTELSSQDEGLITPSKWGH